MAPIEAKPATYKGVRYRSRLEARWAIFFDQLHVPYQYEPHSFKFGDMWYLPDFYLPRQRWWVEIKGQAPTEQELKKAGLLAARTEEGVLLFAGKAWLNTQAYVFIHDSTRAETYRTVPGNHWCRCPLCGDLAIYLRGHGRGACQKCDDCFKEADDTLFQDPVLRKAFETAYQAPLWSTFYQ